MSIDRFSRALYGPLKRGFDFLAAFCACILLLLPMLVIAVLIRFDSPGPALFLQERLGKDGKPFLLYKFRSMRLDAEANGPQWAVKNDSRCTRMGLLLRRTRLDELPQFWNVLKGEMSLVGPRPERAYFYQKLEPQIPDFRRRLAVKPGLTGYALVFGGFDLSPEEKIRYDLAYIEHQSLQLDLICIAKTLRMFLPHRRDH